MNRWMLMLVGIMAVSPIANAQDLHVTLKIRYAADNGAVLPRYTSQQWKPQETAVIICDMWDAHHCLNATRRVKELAVRMNEFVEFARQQGATIIHAPSSCMDFYQDHPARKRALAVPTSPQLPEQIESWCHWKNDAEEQIGYPIDHSDGGEDDDLEEHARWHQQLAAIGRNPQAPWIRQIDLIRIDEQNDYITDDGVQNWSILESKSIKNVLLVGVHLNMCVLGRPFGLRQMSRHGKNVALVKDLTDTMYNPKMPPFVNHFSGTDLVIEHVQQHVCPTITSDQITGQPPFRFRTDRRPHIVMLVGEREYDTNRSLPRFAKQHLYRDYKVTFVHAAEDDPHAFPEIELLDSADLLLISVRRRTLADNQLNIVKRFVGQGKPVVGIRTASHAFALRDGQPQAGHAVWPEFDSQILGGNYQGHHGNKEDADEKTYVWKTDSDSPLVADWPADEKVTTSWLYKTSPLKPGAEVLLMGRVSERMPHEPVAWTFIHTGGGRSFYTSLGHPDDFANEAFQEMLSKAIYWALKTN